MEGMAIAAKKTARCARFEGWSEERTGWVDFRRVQAETQRQLVAQLYSDFVDEEIPKVLCAHGEMASHRQDCWPQLTITQF
eukprot:5426567-Pleurochrysis_carterae.AAC.1